MMKNNEIKEKDKDWKNIDTIEDEIMEKAILFNYDSMKKKDSYSSLHVVGWMLVFVFLDDPNEDYLSDASDENFWF